MHRWRTHPTVSVRCSSKMLSLNSSLASSFLLSIPSNVDSTLSSAPAVVEIGAVNDAAPAPAAFACGHGPSHVSTVTTT